MKFQISDLLRKIDEMDGDSTGDAKGILYKVVTVRSEPCCQLQRLGNSPSKHWAITRELELVAEKSIQVENQSAKQATQ
jgi:hypothetical protein